jgi:hypothetical protein
VKHLTGCDGTGIAQSVERLVKGWTTEGSEFESRWGQEFSFLHVIQTGSGAPTQPPIEGVPGALSPGVKWQGREADHSPPTNAEVKKMWIYTSTPPYVFMSYLYLYLTGYNTGCGDKSFELGTI